MKKSVLLAATALLILSLSSCSRRLLDFTVISTKNVDLKGQFVKSTEKVKGKDLKHFAFVFPIGVPDIKTAIDNAIEKIPGCVALENGVLRASYWHVILYGQQRYIIEGNPLIVKDDVAENIDKNDFQYIVTSHSDSNISSIE